MMALPFLVPFLALLAAWRGWRGLSILLWVVSIAAMLVLFKVHATSVIGIDL